MNLVIRVVLVVFAALFGIFAAANGQAGELKYSSEGESGDIRQVTIHSDGSLLSTTRLGPLVATTSISFDDRRIVITETDDATVTLVTIDRQAAFEVQQEGVLKTALKERAGASADKNRSRRVLSAAADPAQNKPSGRCQDRITGLLFAADAVLSACGSGSGTIGALMCIKAEDKYRDAKHQQSKCIGSQ